MDVRMQIGQLYAEAGALEGEGSDLDAKRRNVGTRLREIGNAENESWGVELGYRYDDSPIIVSEPNAPTVDPLTYRPSTHPGSRLPHVFLADGQSIHDKLGLYFTLVVLDHVDEGPIRAAATKASVPLSILQLHRPDLRAIYSARLLLVRPDQHVAWRGDAVPASLDRILVRAAGRAEGGA
jgi:hypothetical protein